MKVDSYTRAVLTVIAIALVYLCVALTPMPSVHAQRGARPGDDTGPAQCVIVGWKTTDQVPVQVVDSITLKTNGEARITGTVKTEQADNTADRVVMVGWEERATLNLPGRVHKPGRFQPLDTNARAPQTAGIPVTAVPIK